LRPKAIVLLASTLSHPYNKDKGVDDDVCLL